MQTRPVQFTNRVGYALAGLLDVPSDRAPSAYAILAHCFTCGKDLKPFINMSRELTAAGLGVLRFDFSGLGGSEGSFSESDLSSNTTDLRDAADYLANNFAAPRLLIGHSMGGAAVLQVAGEITSVAAVATIAAPAEASHLGEKLRRAREEAMGSGTASVAIGGKHFTLRREFFDDLEKAEVGNAIRRLGKPLLILHSPRDHTVDIENAAAIFQAAKHPKSFVSLGESDHLMLEERHARYAGRMIAAWASAYLSSA
jgi:alpha-beta hydrolase superfamily lysophospholipase